MACGGVEPCPPPSDPLPPQLPLQNFVRNPNLSFARPFTKKRPAAERVGCGPQGKKLSEVARSNRSSGYGRRARFHRSSGHHHSAGSHRHRERRRLRCCVEPVPLAAHYGRRHRIRRYCNPCRHTAARSWALTAPAQSAARFATAPAANSSGSGIAGWSHSAARIAGCSSGLGARPGILTHCWMANSGNCREAAQWPGGTDCRAIRGYRPETRCCRVVPPARVRQNAASC